MSEQSSLYIKIEIKKEKLELFLQDKPAPLSIDENVRSWWESREMYSPIDLATVPQHQLHYPHAHNRAIVDGFLADERMGAWQDYNDAQQTWTFVALQFSENFLEILPMLSFLQQLAAYQSGEEKGTAVIYDFLWGDDSVMVQLDFSGGRAQLTSSSTQSEMDAEIFSEASKCLQHLLDETSKKYDD
ncbi:hypothetical protein [Parapedobacter sp.]